MSKKRKNLDQSMISDNENIKKEIISKMNYCEKCKKNLLSTSGQLVFTNCKINKWTK